MGCYLLFGVLYMRLVAGAKGWEQIPNHDFWVSCCGNVKVRLDRTRVCVFVCACVCVCVCVPMRACECVCVCV